MAEDDAVQQLAWTAKISDTAGGEAALSGADGRLASSSSRLEDNAKNCAGCAKRSMYGAANNKPGETAEKRAGEWPRVARWRDGGASSGAVTKVARLRRRHGEQRGDVVGLIGGSNRRMSTTR
ncbi:hypothetical protein Scep_020892 [Stephania cephalantha]|uniref:YDG domain-containing protein n=1 Tax=Stephania cephalantha TaxID=152367 RepID=A0AAP0F9Q8_9MAGN